MMHLGIDLSKVLSNFDRISESKTTFMSSTLLAIKATLGLMNIYPSISISLEIAYLPEIS